MRKSIILLLVYVALIVVTFAVKVKPSPNSTIYGPTRIAEEIRRKEEKELLKKKLFISNQICSMVRSGGVSFGFALTTAKLHGIEYTEAEFISCLPPRERLAYQRAVLRNVVKNDSNTSHSNSDDLASRLDDLESKINDLESKYSDLDSRLDDLESKINDLDSKYSNLNSRVNDLETSR
jgi:peptidoglycan hydrolase CwlO-like protein